MDNTEQQMIGEILDMYDLGYTEQEISRKLKITQAEVELALTVYETAFEPGSVECALRDAWAAVAK